MQKSTITYYDGDLNCGYAFTDGGVRFLFDSCDRELVESRGWHLSKRGYIAGKEKRCERPLHKMMLSVDSSFDIDHINGNKLDCRRKNLRVCSHQQNCFNQSLRSTNTSGYIGVSYSKAMKKYESYIHRDGHKYSLGFFESPIDAAIARDKTAIQMFGDYARLNFPERRCEYDRETA